MKLSLIDLHCDTIYKMYNSAKSCNDPSLAIHLCEDFHDTYENYLQIAAIWSNRKCSDEEAFTQFVNIIEYLHSDILQSNNVVLSEYFRRSSLFSSPSNQLVLAVEDARLLSEAPDRIEFLYKCGVRFLTLLWKGVTCIGGAYDTDLGLTSFGRYAVKQCTELGIIADISHASEKSAYEILELSKGTPVIASHSNSHAVFPHPRNISDEIFHEICRSDGLVGINLYTEHLGIRLHGASGIDAVLKHIDHFLCLGGEDVICFGCDFDGADTPFDLQHPRDLSKIAEEMLFRGYSETVIEKLFWKNAERFLKKNIFNK